MTPTKREGNHTTMGSVFEKHLGEVYTFRQVTVQFHSRIYGGIPLRPDVIEAWLRKGTGITNQQELAAVVKRTIMELDPDLAESAKTMTPYELMKLASEKLATSQSSVGFKRDNNGLFIESRQIKAGLREATNILYAGKRWGDTKKGPKSWLAERVFVGPERIYLGVPSMDTEENQPGLAKGSTYTQEPTSLELFVGHVTGPQGARSTLTYYQYVETPTITFLVATIQDEVIAQEWPRIWVTLENLGFGALRSQDAGRFDVTAWDEVPPVPLRTLRPQYLQGVPYEGEDATRKATWRTEEDAKAGEAAFDAQSDATVRERERTLTAPGRRR